MRRPAVTTVQALLVLLPSLVAWSPANPIVLLQPESRLWVGGTSTVRSFDCKATAFSGTIEGVSSGAAAAVLAGEQAVRDVSIEVPAAKLECGNRTMNEHMLKALKIKDHPTIRFRLTSYQTSRAADAVTGDITGVLTLGGVDKTITFKGTATDAGAGQFRVIGVHGLRMTEYGIRPPTLMLGTMKVGDVVKVNFDLVLKG